MVSEPKISREVQPEAIRQKAEALIRNFEREIRSGELRQKVLALIPVFETLRRLGKSLIPAQYAVGARDRILHYFRQYPQTIISGNELLVISGIQEYARRVRELRVEFGWAIASGVTIREMCEEDEDMPDQLKGMKPSQYVLFSTEPDRDAAHRWNVANNIRKQAGPVRNKILDFLRANVGRDVTGEELRYVAGNKTEWARRVRELRTEFGWPVATKTTGRPDLSVGVYVLQADRQTPKHDRQIPDGVRRAVLRRDDYKCQGCRWTHDEWNPSDPRHLEIHHVEHHARGGKSVEANLKTLCNICHDHVHSVELQD